MLLKNLPLKQFVKNICKRMLLTKALRKCHYKQPYPNAAKKTAAPNVRQTYP